MTVGDETQKLRDRVEQLTSELRSLRARERLQRAVDEMLEVATRDRLPLRRTLDRVLPIVCEQLGAAAARIYTYDEDLQLTEHWWLPRGQDPYADLDLDALDQAIAAGETVSRPDATPGLLAHPLDVAGEPFGSITLLFERAIGATERGLLLELLWVFCEELDNYLAAIAAARRKHKATVDLSEALKNPLLDIGVNGAIRALGQHVDFEHLVLVYLSEGSSHADTFGYKIAHRGELICDSAAPRDTDIDAWVRAHASNLTQGDSGELLERLGVGPHREEVMISGVRSRRLVGRLIVSSSRDDFSTHDRDLLERFADYLRQRVVDFNREWKYLSLCFPQPVVQRLLGDEDYSERYLQPRLRDAAIMYCDLSGFTRISEQVLRDPVQIGQLFDEWSGRVVELIWRSGGVLDKLVGDCAIGLWGPPFFELSPKEACEAAARCAREIRDFTREMSVLPSGPADQGKPVHLSVATALNYCPLYVGRFGPNEDYTGFSSGMNNTARLQGQAAANEILCMSSFVEVLGQQPHAFDAGQQASVKNVAEPLRYHALRG